MIRLQSGQEWLRAITLSIANALRSRRGDRFHLPLGTRDAPDDPDYGEDRNYPRGKECNRHANHPETPHDCAGALRQCPSQRGERTALMRDNVALAVNLDRDVGRRVGFINLRACAVLALDSHDLEFA